MERWAVGDCIDILPDLERKADLIYVDPPFFTQREWSGAAGSFDDRFAGLLGYLDWLQARLQAMCVALSWNGVLAVHLDDHAWHYVAFLLDWAFGPGHRVSIVKWKRSSGAAQGNKFTRVHDTILVYSIGPDWTFNPQLGEAATDLWLDIPNIARSSSERTGWPTQKPEALLERIILTLTNPGDLVVDPMCGSGTTLAVAHKLDRRTFGCDINPDAIEIAKQRLAPAVQVGLFEGAA
jgi:site-specific DNA-methyltransferase (adenine-specific)